MTKGTLNKKIGITFLICMLIYFVTVNFPLKAYLIQKDEEELLRKVKDTGYFLVEEYVDSAANGEEISRYNFGKLLKTTEYFTGFRFWVVDADGTIITDTQNNLNDGVSVTDISPDYLEQTVIRHDNLEGLIENDCMAVICPINYNYTVRGYLVVHGDYKIVDETIDEKMFLVNLAGAFASLIMLCVAVLYGVYYTIVLNKLIEVTLSYADNKFDERVKMHLSDEHLKLANAIVCLAEKNEGLVEYQKNFIANVSHDFRSPLTSIKGYTEAMKEGIIPPESQGKYLDIILFETERLTGLTQNLLQLNEFDNKGIRLELSVFNVCDMIKRSAATFEAKCAEKKLKIRLVYAEKEIWVEADKSKIQQVLHNLIDNAVKFSNEEQMIVITVSEMPNKIMVSVKDFGIGIPKESITQVWERFYKTDLSRGKDKKGTGLGLSITKQIVNAHGENIMVNSKVGEGTEFKFTLKRAEKP